MSPELTRRFLRRLRESLSTMRRNRIYELPAMQNFMERHMRELGDLINALDHDDLDQRGAA